MARKVKEGDTITFYCVACKKKHPSKVLGIVKKKLKKGRGTVIFATSKCEKHGNKLYKIVGRE